MKYREIYAALQSKGWMSRGSAFLKAQLMRPDDCIKRAMPQYHFRLQRKRGAFCFECLLHPALTGRLITRTGRLLFAACWSSFRGKS